MRQKQSMTLGCNIWMIYLKFGRILQLSEFVLDVTVFSMSSKAIIFRRKPIPPFIFREHYL